jgi:hypothetical protein
MCVDNDLTAKVMKVTYVNLSLHFMCCNLCYDYICVLICLKFE